MQDLCSYHFCVPHRSHRIRFSALEFAVEADSAFLNYARAVDYVDVILRGKVILTKRMVNKRSSIVQFLTQLKN